MANATDLPKQNQHAVVQCRADESNAGGAVTDDTRLRVILGACTRMLWDHLYNPKSPSRVLDQLAVYLQSNDSVDSLSCSQHDVYSSVPHGSDARTRRDGREEGGSRDGNDCTDDNRIRAEAGCSSCANHVTEEAAVATEMELPQSERVSPSHRANNLAARSTRDAILSGQTSAPLHHREDDDGVLDGEDDTCNGVLDDGVARESDAPRCVKPHEDITSSFMGRTPKQSDPLCTIASVASIHTEFSMERTPVAAEAAAATSPTCEQYIHTGHDGDEPVTNRRSHRSSSRRSDCSIAHALSEDRAEVHEHEKQENDEERRGHGGDIDNPVCASQGVLSATSPTSSTSLAPQEYVHCHPNSHALPPRAMQPSALRARSESLLRSHDISHTEEKSKKKSRRENKDAHGCGRSYTLSPVTPNSGMHDHAESELRCRKKSQQDQDEGHTPMVELSPHPCTRSHSREVSLDLGSGCVHSVCREPSTRAHARHAGITFRQEGGRGYSVCRSRPCTPPPPPPHSPPRHSPPMSLSLTCRSASLPRRDDRCLRSRPVRPT